MRAAYLLVSLLVTNGCVSTTAERLGLDRSAEESSVTTVVESSDEEHWLRIERKSNDAEISFESSGTAVTRHACAELDAPRDCPLEPEDHVVGAYRIASAPSPIGSVVIVRDRRGELAVIRERGGKWVRRGVVPAPAQSGSIPPPLMSLAHVVDLITLPVQLALFPLTIAYVAIVSPYPLIGQATRQMDSGKGRGPRAV
jgi:hypothetical protein